MVLRRVPEAQVNAATVETKSATDWPRSRPRRSSCSTKALCTLATPKPRAAAITRLKIISAQFAGQSRVARHRMVYAMLDPLMRHHIHALALVTQAPGES